MPQQLLTDWLTLGTAGPTVDGREISELRLQQAAKNYDPKNYCAVVNVDHYYGNLGTVEEVRLAKDDQGRTCLQGRIRPNQYYLSYNYADMKLFFSMELTDNFAGTGEAYLTGLAATDTPASLGTSCARFSKNGKVEADKYVAQPVAAASFTVPAAGKDNATILEMFKTVLRDFFSANNHKGDTDMTDEQVKTLLTGNQAMQEGISKLVSAIEKLTAGKTETGKTEAANAETPKPEADGKADFSKLSENIVKFGEQVKGLADKLDAALTGKNGTDFGKGTGSTEEQSFV